VPFSKIKKIIFFFNLKSSSQKRQKDNRHNKQFSTKNFWRFRNSFITNWLFSWTFY